MLGTDMSAPHIFSLLSFIFHLFLVYRWWIRGPEKPRNLPKVTQLVNFRPVLIAFIAVKILQIKCISNIYEVLNSFVASEDSTLRLKALGGSEWFSDAWCKDLSVPFVGGSLWQRSVALFIFYRISGKIPSQLSSYLPINSYLLYLNFYFPLQMFYFLIWVSLSLE